MGNCKHKKQISTSNRSTEVSMRSLAATNNLEAWKTYRVTHYFKISNTKLTPGNIQLNSQVEISNTNENLGTPDTLAGNCSFSTHTCKYSFNIKHKTCQFNDQAQQISRNLH